MARALSFLIVLVLLAGDARAVTEAQVGDAIDRMQTYLLGRQDPDTGGWDDQYASSRYHRGGESALVMFALLQSGLSAQDPQMQRGIRFLEDVPMNGTYAIALRSHCWAALPNGYRPRLTRDARWLLKAQQNGLFNYGPRNGPRFDHSVTQYGLLGLWESAKRRGPTASGVWRNTIKHFTEVQNPDGGWGYTRGDQSSPAMTAAGLTALLIAQERLYLSMHRPPQKVSEAIEAGILWLDAFAESGGNISSGSRAMYYLASLERVALASGIKTFSGKDWFDQGARQILQEEAGSGSVNNNVVDTAFALLFLSRGRVPVWINKLRLTGQQWNNRPNDLNILTRKMSDQLEQELNWQVVAVQDDLGVWLNAPVAYLASDRPVHLSAKAMANLEAYLDLGGVLVATPDSDPQPFVDSVIQLAHRLYPAYRFERIGPDHPLLGLVYPVGLPENKRPWVLSNGVRDLIVLAPSDWGMSLQSGKLEHRVGARRIMTNLHALITDLGRVDDRLTFPFVQRRDAEPVGKLIVLRHTEPGKPPVEPLAWAPLRNRFFNRTRLELEIHDRSIENVNGSGASLVYLGGVGEGRLTPAQVRALADFVGSGGTVLVESVGGLSDYAEQVIRQLEAVFNTQAAPIGSDSPILTGVGLTGGFDDREAGYRRFSVLNMGLVNTPRLTAIEVGGRAAVIASHEDLSLGVLGDRRWGVNGYDVDSARSLLTNILLYAAQSLPVKPFEKQPVLEHGQAGQ